jgi:hypothetical protein
MAKVCSNPTYVVCRFMDDYGMCRLKLEESCRYQEDDPQEGKECQH